MKYFRDCDNRFWSIVSILVICKLYIFIMEAAIIWTNTELHINYLALYMKISACSWLVIHCFWYFCQNTQLFNTVPNRYTHFPYVPTTNQSTIFKATYYTPQLTSKTKAKHTSPSSPSFPPLSRISIQNTTHFKLHSTPPLPDGKPKQRNKHISAQEPYQHPPYLSVIYIHTTCINIRTTGSLGLRSKKTEMKPGPIAIFPLITLVSPTTYIKIRSTRSLRFKPRKA